MFLKPGREMDEPSGRSLSSIDQGNVKFAKSASLNVVNPIITDLRKILTYRTTQCAQLPVQNTNDTVLGRVEDYIIEFVVSMNDAQTNFFFVRKVATIPVDKLVKARDVTNWLVSFNVDGEGLCSRHAGEGFDLAREVIDGGTE